MTCGFCGKYYSMDQKEFPNACPKCALLGLTGKLAPQDIKRNKAHRDTNTPSKGKIPPKTKKSPKTLAMSRADKYFSRYVRLKHGAVGTENRVICICYTCGAIKTITDIDNGHFINREKLGTRYHEDNCRPQCRHCNKWKSGRHYDFEYSLIGEIGIERVDELKELAQPQPGLGTELWYNAIADEYRKKVSELQKQMNVKIW